MTVLNEPMSATVGPKQLEELPRLRSGTECERAPVRDDGGNPVHQGWIMIWVGPGRSSTVVSEADDEQKRWASLARRALRRWMSENPY